MNFKQATDALLESITLPDLAEAMNVSVQAVRQARTSEESAGHRLPPPAWEKAVARLAGRRAAKLSRLSAKIQGS
jgi:hypothetical protein